MQIGKYAREILSLTRCNQKLRSGKGVCIQGTYGGGGDDKGGEKAANLAKKSDVEILTRKGH